MSDATALGSADVRKVEEIVRPCGLFHVKAADVVGECRMLCEEYGGELPERYRDVIELTKASLMKGKPFCLAGYVACPQRTMRSALQNVICTMCVMFDFVK